MNHVDVSDPRGVVHVWHDQDGHCTRCAVEIPAERMTSDELVETADEIRAVLGTVDDPSRLRRQLARVERELRARYERKVAA